MAIIGGVLGKRYKIHQRKKLLIETEAPDYETYKKIKEGQFTNYPTYLKAKKLNIDTQEEYKFQMELLDRENS